MPFSPSVFDLNATEDFLQIVKKEMLSANSKIALVAMRTDVRLRAAQNLETFADEVHFTLRAILRPTQNYVNAAMTGATIFDPPHAKNKKDAEQWSGLLKWLNE